MLRALWAVAVATFMTVLFGVLLTELITSLVDRLLEIRVYRVLLQAGIPDADDLIRRLRNGTAPITTALSNIHMGNHIEAWTAYLNEALRRDATGSVRRVLLGIAK